jgi:putative integral membrane protein (TIGR02587 family)
VTEAKNKKHPEDPHGFRQEGQDLLRGVAGGTIVGAPLLYTMEVWFHGVSYHTAHLLGALLLTIALNVAFCYFAGLRERYDQASFTGAIDDAVTALALGVFVAAAILALIGQVDPGDGFGAIAGKVVLEACIVSVGITFTNFKFRQKIDERAGSQPHASASAGAGALTDEQKQLHADLMDLAAAASGAFVFAFNVAPTEEIVLIASGLGPFALLLLLLTTMLVAYIVLYAAGFKDHKVYEQDSLFQAPSVETLMTVGVAIGVSALLMALFGESSATASPSLFIATVVTLGFPAAVGAAAGRLII